MKIWTIRNECYSRSDEPDVWEFGYKTCQEAIDEVKKMHPDIEIEHVNDEWVNLHYNWEPHFYIRPVTIN